MKLINSSVIVKEQESGIDGVYKQIEWAGRHCYKSLDKITEDSAKEFVDRMIKLGHGAILEHGTVYLAIPMTTYAPDAVNKYRGNAYSKVNDCNEFIFTDKYGDKVAAWCVTTNLRVLVENDCLEDLEFLCEPTEHHEKRITAKFICDRATANQFVRHRVFSFAQESQRYCNYSKDKFNKEILFIKPTWYKDDASIVKSNERTFCEILQKCETYYFYLLEDGAKPQEARGVLPNATKTELVMTGFESDWEGFFKLRCSGAAHPDAKKLADELKSLMNVKNIELNSVK